MKLLVSLSLIATSMVALAQAQDPERNLDLERSQYSFPALNYFDAQLFCENRNGSLPFIITDWQQRRLTANMKKEKLQRVWIGLNRHNKKGEWLWHTLENIDPKASVQYWGPGEPNNYENHDEECGEMRDLDKNNDTHNWNDRPCEDVNPFFCDFLN